jgi:hypothetical protein
VSSTVDLRSDSIGRTNFTVRVECFELCEGEDKVAATLYESNYVMMTICRYSVQPVCPGAIYHHQPSYIVPHIALLLVSI